MRDLVNDGRADDLLIVRGVNLSPSEIEHVVLDIDGVAPHYRSTSTRRTIST